VSAGYAACPRGDSTEGKGTRRGTGGSAPRYLRWMPGRERAFINGLGRME